MHGLEQGLDFRMAESKSGKNGLPIFVNWSQKSVTIATYLERSRNEGRLITPTHMFTFPENLAKIDQHILR